MDNIGTLASGKGLGIADQAQADQAVSVTQPGDLDLDVVRGGQLRGRRDAEAQNCQGHRRLRKSDPKILSRDHNCIYSADDGADDG